MDNPLELTLTLHGLDRFNEDVDAVIFAQKLTAFLRGIRHCDRAANGKVRHKLLLTELTKNTATASVREQAYPTAVPPASAMAVYSRAVDAIYNRRSEAWELPAALLVTILNLNKGVGQSFAFGEIKSNHGQSIRIDPHSASIADTLIQEVKRSARPDVGTESRYTGLAFGSFDGELKAVDLRGETKRGKLILTAGKREIECTLDALGKEELQAALDTRIMAYGLAHYDRSSLLPLRVEITKAEPLAPRAGADLSRWRGAFRASENHAEDWN